MVRIKTQVKVLGILLDRFLSNFLEMVVVHKPRYPLVSAPPRPAIAGVCVCDHIQLFI